MRKTVEQHIGRILLDLRAARSERMAPADGERMLRKHLEKLPHKDIVSLNAVMYAGRDNDSPQRIEQQIGHSGVFSKDDLIQALLMRFDNLQDLLVQGKAKASLGLESPGI